MPQFTLPSLSPPSVISKTPLIRILLVDDQPFALELLQSYFQKVDNVEVVETTTQGQSSLALIGQYQPDLVILDIEMPDINGLTLTQRITENFRSTKVLVLSSHDQATYIKQALEAGAQGYLLKGTPAHELVLAVQFIHQGYLHLGPGLFEKLETYAKGDRVGDLAVRSQDNITALEHSAPAVIEQVDVSAPVQERLNQLPKAWSRGLLYCVIVFLAIALPWAALSKVDETGVARGRLEPQGQTLRLDAPLSGRVSQVKVKEGQVVTKGQVLLELESEEIRSTLKQTQTRLDGQRHQFTQLNFLKNQVLTTLNVQSQQNQAQLLEKVSQVNQAEDAVGVSRRNITLELAEKQTQIDQVKATIEAAKTGLASARERYHKDLAEVDRYRSLEQKGVVSAVQVVEAERLADESQRRKDQLQAELTQTQKQLQEQQASYQRLQHQLTSNYQQNESKLEEQELGKQGLQHNGELILLKTQEQLNQLESEIAVLQSEITQTEAEIKALAFQLKKHQVRSPIDGTIFQLPVKQEAVYLEPGRLIAQIAPKGMPLVLKAQMPNPDSGFIEVGLPVKLKFDAYPFQDYGVVPGTVRWISPDSKRDPQNQSDLEYFELEIVLEQMHIQNASQTISLSSGQTATAEVIIRQRRVLDFILDPFKQLQKDGIRL